MGEWVVQSPVDRTYRYEENSRSAVANYFYVGRELHRIFIQMLIRPQYRRRWACPPSFRERAPLLPGVSSWGLTTRITGSSARVKAPGHGWFRESPESRLLYYFAVHVARISALLESRLRNTTILRYQRIESRKCKIRIESERHTCEHYFLSRYIMYESFYFLTSK